MKAITEKLLKEMLADAEARHKEVSLNFYPAEWAIEFPEYHEGQIDLLKILLEQT